MLRRLRGRVAGICVIAGVALVGLGAFGPSARANVALSGWTAQGGAAAWAVQGSGDSVKVNAPNPDSPQTNGSPSFFVSPFSAGGTFYVNLTPNLEADDDYIGFAVGYTKPINDATCQSAATCDTGFYLFDWKRAQEMEGTPPAATTDGHEGFSLMHVQGQHDLRNNNTAAHIDCFWTHQTTAGACDVLGTSFGSGKGYQFGTTYTFQVTYTTTQIKIVLLGTGGNADTTIFDVAAAQGSPFPAGRLGFYNYSQPEVTYGVDTAAPTSSSTTSSSTSTTAAPGASTTRATVGPAVSNSIVRTGPDSGVTTMEIASGLALILTGALMTAARGRRPEGRFYT